MLYKWLDPTNTGAASSCKNMACFSFVNSGCCFTQKPPSFTIQKLKSNLWKVIFWCRGNNLHFRGKASTKLWWHSWTHKGVTRMWLSRTWLKCLLLYWKMKVICLPVRHRVNIWRCVHGGMGKTQARRDKLKGASQSFNFKVIKFTAKITVCVRNRSRDADNDRWDRGQGKGFT